MNLKEQIKEWIVWYSQPPVDVFKKYGDALEFTVEEKIMSAILRKEKNVYKLK